MPKILQFDAIPEGAEIMPDMQRSGRAIACQDAIPFRMRGEVGA